MQDLLKKIHKKPKAYRRKVAYAVTAFFGLVACFLWLSITTSNIKDLQGTQELSENFQRELPSLKEENSRENQESRDANSKDKSENSSYKELQEN
ncbi:MAG: hypothetical protein ACOCUF_02145 [Patescibacteria group bacterium]